MKQLGHASQLIPLIHPQDDDEQIMSDDDLLQLLSRQLNHSDGIRGFFATYLTSPESLTTEEVPKVLADAVKSSDMEVMIPLACMNVIMPTAMSSIHQDDELKECARKTATNGIKILRLLKDEEDVVKNCKAILKVCNGVEEEGDDMIKVCICDEFAFAFVFMNCKVYLYTNLSFSTVLGKVLQQLPV